VPHLGSILGLRWRRGDSKVAGGGGTGWRPPLCPWPGELSAARPTDARFAYGSEGGGGSHGRNDRLGSRVAPVAAGGGTRAERPPRLAVRRRRLDLAAGVNRRVAGLARAAGPMTTRVSNWSRCVES
jgi:hypothetical protein